MSDLGGAPPRLPRSAWVLAWSYLGGQLLVVPTEGVDDSNLVSIVVSMALGGLVVGWFAAGVLRARRVRVAFVWALTVLVALVELIGLLFVGDVGDGLLAVGALAISALSLTALARFCQSDYFRWQRRRPAAEGQPIGQLVAIAVVVGVLGGLVGPADDGATLEISWSRAR